MDCHVLVVEDEDAIRRPLVAVLADAGYSTAEATNGVEALAAVVAHVPDVILLDLTLPLLDGWQFLARLRAEPAWAPIPVLVLSGSHRPSWDPANVAGVLAYLAKPYQPGAVLHEVQFLYEFAQSRQGRTGADVPHSPVTS